MPAPSRKLDRRKLEDERPRAPRWPKPRRWPPRWRRRRPRRRSRSARRRPCRRGWPRCGWQARRCVGGQDCHAEAERRLHRRRLGRDAGRRRREPGHPRPLRAARRTTARPTRWSPPRSEAALRGRAGARSSASARPWSEREAGRALEVVRRPGRGLAARRRWRAKAFAVAYEPVWAIGTGLTPTLERDRGDARARSARDAGGAASASSGAALPILYGGSVKPANAAEILAAAEVGGGLVGGASLKADGLPGHRPRRRLKTASPRRMALLAGAAWLDAPRAQIAPRLHELRPPCCSASCSSSTSSSPSP